MFSDCTAAALDKAIEGTDIVMSFPRHDTVAFIYRKAIPHQAAYFWLGKYAGKQTRINDQRVFAHDDTGFRPHVFDAVKYALKLREEYFLSQGNQTKNPEPEKRLVKSKNV